MKHFLYYFTRLHAFVKEVINGRLAVIKFGHLGLFWNVYRRGRIVDIQLCLCCPPVPSDLGPWWGHLECLVIDKKCFFNYLLFILKF